MQMEKIPVEWVIYSATVENPNLSSILEIAGTGSEIRVLEEF